MKTVCIHKTFNHEETIYTFSNRKKDVYSNITLKRVEKKCVPKIPAFDKIFSSNKIMIPSFLRSPTLAFLIYYRAGACDIKWAICVRTFNALGQIFFFRPLSLWGAHLQFGELCNYRRKLILVRSDLVNYSNVSSYVFPSFLTTYAVTLSLR